MEPSKRKSNSTVLYFYVICFLYKVDNQISYIILSAPFICSFSNQTTVTHIIQHTVKNITTNLSSFTLVTGGDKTGAARGTTKYLQVTLNKQTTTK